MPRLALLAAFLLLLGAAGVLARTYQWRPVPTRAELVRSDRGPALRIQLRPDRTTLCECYVRDGRVACLCAGSV